MGVALATRGILPQPCAGDPHEELRRVFDRIPGALLHRRLRAPAGDQRRVHDARLVRREAQRAEHPVPDPDELRVPPDLPARRPTQAPRTMRSQRARLRAARAPRSSRILATTAARGLRPRRAHREPGRPAGDAMFLIQEGTAIVTIATEPAASARSPASARRVLRRDGRCSRASPRTASVTAVDDLSVLVVHKPRCRRCSRAARPGPGDGRDRRGAPPGPPRHPMSGSALPGVSLTSPLAHCATSARTTRRSWDLPRASGRPLPSRNSNLAGAPGSSLAARLTSRKPS
jgi:hypothetical protein